MFIVSISSSYTKVGRKKRFWLLSKFICVPHTRDVFHTKSLLTTVFWHNFNLFIHSTIELNSLKYGKCVHSFTMKWQTFYHLKISRVSDALSCWSVALDRQWKRNVASCTAIIPVISSICLFVLLTIPTYFALLLKTVLWGFATIVPHHSARMRMRNDVELCIHLLDACIWRRLVKKNMKEHMHFGNSMHLVPLIRQGGFA